MVVAGFVKQSRAGYATMPASHVSTRQWLWISSVTNLVLLNHTFVELILLRPCI